MEMLKLDYLQRRNMKFIHRFGKDRDRVFWNAGKTENKDLRSGSLSIVPQAMILSSKKGIDPL
jgi:hypothetical protein